MTLNPLELLSVIVVAAIIGSMFGRHFR